MFIFNSTSPSPFKVYAINPLPCACKIDYVSHSNYIWLTISDRLAYCLPLDRLPDDPHLSTLNYT